MSTALAPAAPSLFDIEQDLLCLLETDEMCPPEQRAEFERDLSLALQKSVEKRDRVAQFLQHVSLQQENCDREIERLRKRRESFERAEKRMKMYVQRVIESLGPDAKGKPKKLEGNLATFSLRQTPGHIEVIDESKVPADLKVSTVTVSIDKREAKRRIEAGEEIPGIDLTMGGYCLLVK
jgi:hypothetical protein